MRRDLLRLNERGLITSYLPRVCGTDHEDLFAVSSAGLVYINGLKCHLTNAAKVAAPPKSRSLKRFTWQRYRHQLRRLMLRLPHYVQLQELADWLTIIWRDQFSPEISCDVDEILGIPIFDNIADNQQHSQASKPSWRWLRDASVVFDYHGRHTSCVVDAVAVATYGLTEAAQPSCRTVFPSHARQWTNSALRSEQYQQTTVLLWVYLDDGISPTNSLCHRLCKLLRYRQEQGIDPDDFPAVIVRASSRQRAWQWAQAVQQSAERLGLEPLHGILLFPGEETGIVSAKVNNTVELIAAKSRKLTWPFIQNGLATTQEPQVLAARDLRWQQLITCLDQQEGRTCLAKSLFRAHNSDVARTIVGILKVPDHVLHVPHGVPCVLASQVSDLITYIPVGLPSSASPVRRLTRHAADRGLTRRHLTTGNNKMTAIRRDDKRQLFASLVAELDSHSLMLLALVANHPFITLEDLATLAHQEGRSFTRHIVALRHAKLIEQKLLPAPSTGFPVVGWRSQSTGMSMLEQSISHAVLQCLCVQPLGFEFLSALYGLPPQKLGFEQRLGMRLTSHDAGIHRFLGLLVEQIRDIAQAGGYSAGSDDFRVTDMELIRWRAAPAVSLRFPVVGETVRIAPDAEGSIRVSILNGHKNYLVQDELTSHLHLHLHRFWLEWDSGSENRRDLWDKLVAYQSYARFHAWSAPEHTLPALLIVAPHEQQERRILRIVMQLHAASGDSNHPGGTARVHLSQSRQVRQQICWWAERYIATHAVDPETQPTRHELKTSEQSRFAVTTVRQPSLTRLMVYLTTTHRIGQYGPLGPCWLVQCLG
jgi:hypothetical protein